MKILIIDDEKYTIKKIVTSLSNENWTMEYATSYDSWYKNLQHKRYDVILCDYHFIWDDEKNWVNLIKNIRKEWNTTPVILITWKSLDDVTPWGALNSWCDDFIKKPFEPEELKARILAVIRRNISASKKVSNFITFKNLEINFANRKVRLDWKDIKLWNILFLILFKLVQNKYNIVTYQELIEYIWWEPSLYSKYTNWTLRVHMKHLKDAVWDFSKHIKTVHSTGYILEDYDE
jgi:DNA-binding response OmpR family regulator